MMMNNNYIPLECELLQRIVNKDSIVLDIGANTGTYTLYLAHLAKHVYAFEPEPDNFKQLEENTKLLDNVDLLEQAISNDIGFKYLYLCSQDSGMHRLYDSQWCKDKKKVMVSTSTLDFWMQFIIGKISFIKIDIEGYEYYAIKGMTKLIQRDKPVIMMEFHPPTLIEAGTNPLEFYNFMINELGYYKPKHCLLPGYPTINSYEELHDYTNEIPAINILWSY